MPAATWNDRESGELLLSRPFALEGSVDFFFGGISALSHHFGDFADEQFSRFL
jgi:hypothetical protein